MLALYDDDLVIERHGIVFANNKTVHYVAAHRPDKTLCDFSIIYSDTHVPLVKDGKMTETTCSTCKARVERAAATANVRLARVVKRRKVTEKMPDYLL
jgi:hypothetical protein